MSAGSFAFVTLLPLAMTALAPAHSLIPWVSGRSLFLLALPGEVAAWAGGAGRLLGAWWVTFWRCPGDGDHGGPRPRSAARDLR